MPARTVSDKAADKRSNCPVANSLQIFGDKWTLVVLRDLHLGKNTYSELAASSENIPTNRLAERLVRLVDEGIVEKQLYQERPKRYKYALTQKGKDVFPILKAFTTWGRKYL